MKQIRTETGVCHFRVGEAQRLLAFLRQQDLSELGEIAFDPVDCIYTGGVYVDGRRVREDADLQPGALVRLHTRRKRYVVVPLIDRIVFQNPDFVVLDKPAGMPTHATLDNSVENAKFLLEQELGVPVYTTHRLDVPTTGLLILAKTLDAQKRINRLFAEGLVEKTYYATATHDLEPGFYTHYIEPTLKAPRPISLVKSEGWWECRLQIESVGVNHRHRVRLLTGKTHQIRAQFAALGAPLVGDTQYGAPSADQLGLECAELSFLWRKIPLHFLKSPPPEADTNHT